MIYNMTFTLDQHRFNEYNDRRFKIGDLVYFINSTSETKAIDWGIVEEVFRDGYVLKVYELVDRRMIRGVPIAQFDWDAQRYEKIPKDFFIDEGRINMKYHNMICSERDWTPEEKAWVKASDIRTLTLEFIAEGLRIGAIKVPSEQDVHAYADWRIDKNGIRIERTRESLYSIHSLRDSIGHRTSNNTSVPFHEAYATFEEAESVRQTFFDKIRAIQNMTDDEWDEYDLDNTLKNCMYTKEYKEYIKKTLLNPPYKGVYEWRCYGGKLEIVKNGHTSWAIFNTNEHGEIEK